MAQSPQNSQYWPDDDLSSDPLAEHGDVTLAGLPESWRNYKWWFASLVFSAVWMLQSWSSLGSLPGLPHSLHLSRSMVSLLLSLGFCWALYQFCKPYSQALGRVTCIISAMVLLLQYAG